MDTLNYDFIQTCSPRAWDDFMNFYKKEFGTVNFISNIDFLRLPFEMQLGIYLKYFSNNGVELDVCNTKYDLLPQTITEAFKNFEYVLTHYS